MTQRAGEMVALRGQLKELNAQLREREDAMLGLKDSYTSKTLELDRCEVDLQKTLKEVTSGGVGVTHTHTQAYIHKPKDSHPC